jgi:hypothetical protein
LLRSQPDVCDPFTQRLESVVLPAQGTSLIEDCALDRAPGDRRQRHQQDGALKSD